jgi:hypothetical protein
MAIACVFILGLFKNSLDQMFGMPYIVRLAEYTACARDRQAAVVATLLRGKD